MVKKKSVQGKKAAQKATGAPALPVLKAHPKAAATLSEALEDLARSGSSLLPRLGMDAASLEIGLALKAARLKAGMTQTDLSKRTGIPQSAISDIENGKGTEGPSFRTIRQLADALGAEIEIKPAGVDGDRARQALQALAQLSELMLVNTASGPLVTSLLGLVLESVDKKVLAELMAKAKVLSATASAKAEIASNAKAVLGGPASDLAAFWELAAHKTAKVALPAWSVYFVYGGAARIEGAHPVSDRIAIAGPDETVGIANTGDVAATVLTAPLGMLTQRGAI